VRRCWHHGQTSLPENIIRKKQLEILTKGTVKNLTRAKAELALEILGSQVLNFFVFVDRYSTA